MKRKAFAGRKQWVYKMKIVLTDAQTVTNGDLDLSVLRQFGEVTEYPLTSYEETVSHVGDADVVLCNKTVFDEKIFAACPNLKYIGLFATGYNIIDIEAARRHGVTVSNAGSYSTDSVAQHVFAMILHHATPVAAYDAFVHADGWVQSPTFSPFIYPMQELSGKTLGIIGYGSIGRTVAKIALAFGMKVLVHTRTPKEDPAVTFVPLDALLQGSDYVSIHTPLTEQTAKLFSRKTFAQMKDGAYLINTSRGGVIDEEALCEALESGKLSGAAVDVLTREPMAADCPLRHAPNLVFTPHVAWAPYETRVRLLSIVIDNLKGFLEGDPKHVVS